MKNLFLTGLATTFLLLSFRTIAGTQKYVGPNSDANCDYDSIQAALDSGATDLLISNAMQYNENLVLPETNSRVDFRGGYTSCSSDSYDPTLKSTLSGHLATAPVLNITPSSVNKTIYLSNMNFFNGTGSGFTPAGGINMPNSNDTLALYETTIGLNQGSLGGGIYIGSAPGTPFADQPNLIMNNGSLIINNSSNSDAYGGGGIFCENGSVNIYSNASIKRNSTEGSGGGVYSMGCYINEWSGKNGENDPEQGIYDNQAKSHGGGIYATNNSVIQLGTASQFSKRYGSVINNTADSDNDGNGDGGGIYATDSNVNLLGSIVQGNRSGGHGGGIFAQDGGTVYVQRQNDLCWTAYKCNQIINNHASSNGNGGAIYLTNGANGFINSAYFEGNRADNGTAIYATSENSDTSIRNAVFYKNGDNGADGFSDNNVIMTNNDSSILSVHNTFYDNAETVSTFRSQNNSDLTIQGNIIYSQTASSAYRTANAFPVTVDCVNTNLLPLEGNNVFTYGILFRDEINGDFRLAGNDIGATDTCPNFGQTVDIEGNARPYDNLQLDNLYGPYDVGADEFNDLIFKDGFE